MAGLGTAAVRERARGTAERPGEGDRGVIREICLIGARGISARRLGDRIKRSGRLYHVAAVQPPERNAPEAGRRRGYVHLESRDRALV